MTDYFQEEMFYQCEVCLGFFYFKGNVKFNVDGHAVVCNVCVKDLSVTEETNENIETLR